MTPFLQAGVGWFREDRRQRTFSSMSGLNWGVGDLLAVTKLAWDLYHNCYLVAREAPEDFRQLVNELASLQGVLRTLRDDVNSDKSFLERMGDSRKETLERCVGSCFYTLDKLEKLVIKYRELGIGDGKKFWAQLKWVNKQKEIADLKSRIMVHTCNLSLCMTSIGNSSLARIETSMIQALERQEATKEIEQSSEELTPIARAQTAPVLASLSTEAADEEPEGLGITRAFTGATLVDPTEHMSPDLTPPESDEDRSEYNYSKAISRKQKSVPIRKVRKASTFSVQQDEKASLPSPPTSDESANDYAKKLGSRRPISNSGESAGKAAKEKVDQRQSAVMDAVAEAMQELSRVRKQEQSARPLRIVHEDPIHRADDALKERFLQLAEEELRIRRLNAKDWLRVATWWLLKARFNAPELKTVASTRSQASLRLSDDPSSNINQAYVDLLKSSWILHTMILDESNVSSLMTDENRKLFYNLSDGINEDLSKFKLPDTLGREALMDQNINIWELLQPEEEETLDEGTMLPELDSQRWITVEQDDAGEEDEKVLFRTFVNAAIGSKKYRIKSRGAPYMLMLSTKDGESQPKVTICNQSGSISLTRDFTSHDLQEESHMGSPYSADGDMKDGVPLHFGKMSITVAFVDEGDQQRFMDLPRTYFNAVKRREPRSLEKATETLLFDRSVELCEQLKPATLKPFSPRQQFRACDLRILETTGKEGWRTTRRLAISSSVSEKRPWCTEIFLPLSNVHISRESMGRETTVKWSDCTHELSDRTDGNYNRIYTYAYDQNNPNVALKLLFRNAADAADFENTVLNLSLSPAFSCTSGPDNRQVYNISDNEPNPKSYKAMLLTHTRLEWRYSELFYMYRDTDYILNSTPPNIRFSQAHYTDYISSHVDKLYKAENDQPPQFSHCEKRVGNLSIGFDDEAVSFAFLSALTTGHNLLYSRRAQYVTTKTPRRFSITKSNSRQADIQLWQTKSTKGMQLLARWQDESKVEDNWLSIPLPKDILEQSNDSGSCINLRNSAYRRGRKMDMAHLAATDSRRNGEGEKRGPVVICFENARDREEFFKVVGEAAPGSMLVGRKKSAFDELMTTRMI
ncbi:MAG: hypothetical protein Q9218_007501 [Villophora microphyllina]